MPTGGIDVVLPPGMVIGRLTADGKNLPVIEQGVRKQGCKLVLPKGDAVYAWVYQW